LSLKDL